MVESCVLSGEHHQHQLAYHYMQLFCKHMKCEVKHNGIGDKALMAEMGGAFNGWDSYG